MDTFDTSTVFVCSSLVCMLTVTILSCVSCHARQLQSVPSAVDGRPFKRFTFLPRAESMGFAANSRAFARLLDYMKGPQTPSGVVGVRRLTVCPETSLLPKVRFRQPCRKPVRRLSDRLLLIRHVRGHPLRPRDAKGRSLGCPSSLQRQPKMASTPHPRGGFGKY